MNTKLKKYENLSVFLIVPYYYKKIEHQRLKLIMKMKEHFMKVVLLNEVVKTSFVKLNLGIRRSCDSS
jgi:hypothetical protein